MPTSVPEGGGDLSATGYDGEQFVSTANETAAMGGTAGDGAGTIAPVTTFSVSRGAGQPAVTGQIYTYVTWRDEECGILNLSDTLSLGDLETQLQALNSRLSSATSDLTAMTSSIELDADDDELGDHRHHEHPDRPDPGLRQISRRTSTPSTPT